MKKTFLFITCVAVLATGCSTKKSGDSTEVTADSTSSGDAKTEVSQEGSSAASPDIVLKGIYATSTQIPHSKFSYRNLFDGNNNTYWSTMPGAAPDEGIMLYFDKPVAIDILEITQPVAESIAPIRSFSIYTNGQKLADRNYQNNRLKLDASNVYSLFIRLDGFNEIDKSDKEGTVITTFPSQKTAAISELNILLKSGTKANIITPKQVKGTITASSTLSPDLAFGVRNLFDSRSEFAWAEGDKGNGVGQFLNLQFQDEQTITALEVVNGYQRSEKHFTANTRVKSLLMSDENGKQSELKLTDDTGEQTALLSDPVKGKNIKIQVKDVYPGSTYKDMVISEIKFINGKTEFILEDNITESLKTSLLKKAKGTILEKVLDHRIGNELREPDGYVSSLILRSDYTFVSYKEGWSENGQESQTDETIADGNWEIKELSAGRAVIRIFGKLVQISKTSGYYSGEESSEDLKIFQDILTIDEDGIHPEKFLTPLVMASPQK